MIRNTLGKSMFYGCLLMLVSVGAIAAEQFPTKPVRLMVPYAPGGATDITARQLAAGLTKAWGQQVIVDNRPGASGNIALELAARSTPDGYTLFVGNVSTNAINETTFAKVLKTKPSRDLTGVTNLIELPHLWTASTAVPSNNLKEFAQYAKTSGTHINYGSAGVGSYPHLDALVFFKTIGVQTTHVPYTGGAGQLIPAIMGNQIQFMLINMASSLSNIKAGRIKALAVTPTERHPEFPNVPTTAEMGFPGIGTSAWNALFAPAKLPKSRLNSIHADVYKIMDAPEMKESLNKRFMTVVVNKTPAEFNDFVSAEVKKWGKIVIDNNVTVD